MGDPGARVDPALLEAALLDFVLAHPGCTLADLCGQVPGCSGEQTYQSTRANLIFWKGLSSEAIAALRALEQARAIRFEATTVHPYGQAGRALGLPYAMQPEDFETAHWLPVRLHANRRISAR